jgi:hypothetical protein
MSTHRQRKPKGVKHSKSTDREEKSVTTTTKTVLAVRGQIRPRKELKFVDLAAATYGFSTTGTITLLNGISEGDDYTNRNSRNVVIKSVAARGYVFAVGGLALGASTPAKARHLLVWDNASNGALPAITDVLTSADSFAFPSVNNEKRFTILYDRTYVIGPLSTTATQAYADSTQRDVECLVKLDAPVEFIGTGATIASIGNGALLAITVGSAGVNVTSGSIGYRVRFMENDAL